MRTKQMRRLIEKLADELDYVEMDLESAAEENSDYEFRLSEKEEEAERLEAELQFLCQLLYDANVSVPLEGHFADINPFVPAKDPHKGHYEYDL